MKKWLSLFIFFIFFAFFAACTEKKPMNEEEVNILKIGTTRGGFKSASLLGDTFLGLFARISNPPLMTMTKDGRLKGLLISRTEVSDDCRKWKFYFDLDMRWSDGTPVTAEDARYSIQLYAKEVPYARWMREIIDKAYIAEDEALVLELKRPYSRLDFDFASHNILPKHVWENIEDPLRHSSSQEIVGCGPFVIEKIDINAGLIRFKKNPYWSGNEPELEGIEIHFYNNSDVLALALEKGEVDTYYRYASSYPYPNIERLKAKGEFDFWEEPNFSLKFLGFNMNKKPMSDGRFREAVSYALDYEELIRLDLLGYGEVPSRGFIPPIMPAYKKTGELKHEPSKAESLLTQAGYIDRDRDGFRETADAQDMKLFILIGTDYVRLAELVQDYLRSVGIDAHLKTVDYNTWISMKDKGNYDFVVSRTSPWGMFMHASWATGYFDARRTGEGVLHNVTDPQFLELCDNILSTKDEKRLIEYASRVQDYYALHLPAVPLYWSRSVIPYQKRFKGWSPDPLYGLYNIQNFLSLRINE